MKLSAQIVYGGGWRGTRIVRIKGRAWLTLFLGLGFGELAAWVETPDWLYFAVPGGLLLVVAIVLFFVEKPREVEWPTDDAEHDPRKLYGTSGGRRIGQSSGSGGSPQGAPGTPVDNPRASEGPPSVS